MKNPLQSPHCTAVLSKLHVNPEHRELLILAYTRRNGGGGEGCSYGLGWEWNLSQPDSKAFDYLSLKPKEGKWRWAGGVANLKPLPPRNALKEKTDKWRMCVLCGRGSASLWGSTSWAKLPSFLPSWELQSKLGRMNGFKGTASTKERLRQRQPKSGAKSSCSFYLTEGRHCCRKPYGMTPLFGKTTVVIRWANKCSFQFINIAVGRVTIYLWVLRPVRLELGIIVGKSRVLIMDKGRELFKQKGASLGAVTHVSN